MKNVIVDYRISDEEKNTLKLLGYETLICPPLKTLYEAVSGHPDMLIHIIDSNTIIVHREMNEAFVSILKSLGKNIIFSSDSVGSSYPQDIILNAVNLKNFFIHNIKYTDSALLKMVSNKKIFNVKQGYTKCSTAILNDTAVMTSDTGIAYALRKHSIDALLLPPGDILLPGLNYGFIGGCCGLLENNVLAFYGNLKYYKYKDDVLTFLKKHHVEPVFLRDDKLIDRGSLFAIYS